MFETVLAKPYHFRRNEVCYLRLRVRGATAESITFSLRTPDKTIALAISKAILKRLAVFHLAEPSATWQQLKMRLHTIARDCFINAYGDASVAVYEAAHGKHSRARYSRCPLLVL